MSKIIENSNAPSRLRYHIPTCFQGLGLKVCRVYVGKGTSVGADNLPSRAEHSFFLKERPHVNLFCKAWGYLPLVSREWRNGN